MDWKKVFSLINIPLMLITIYTGRILYFGSRFEDAPILGILALVYLGLKYLDTKKIVINENLFRKQVNEDMSKIKSELSRIKLNSANIFSKNNLRVNQNGQR